MTGKDKGSTNSSSESQGIQWLSVSQMISFGTKLGKGVVIPKLLSPSGFGLYSSLNLFLGYTRYGQFGVAKHLEKNLPRVDDDEFGRLAYLGLIWNLCTSLIVGLALVLLAYFYHGTDAWFYRPAFCILAFINLTKNLKDLFSKFYRCTENYFVQAIGQITTAVSSLLLAVVGILLYGIFGVVIALLMTEILTVSFYIQRSGTLKIRRTYVRLRDYVEMIYSGLRLITLDFIQNLIRTVDQWFIFLFFATADFGIYKLGFFIVNTALSIKSIIAIPFYPKIMNLSSEGTETEQYELLNRTQVVYYFLTVLGILFFLPFVEIVINFYLPDYSKGIPVYIVMTLLAINRGDLMLMKYYFISHDREFFFMILLVTGIVIAGALDGLVVLYGGGMTFIVHASIMSYLILILLMHALIEAEQKTISWFKYVWFTGSYCFILLYLFLDHTVSNLGFVDNLRVKFIPLILYLIFCFICFLFNYSEMKKSLDIYDFWPRLGFLT